MTRYQYINLVYFLSKVQSIREASSSDVTAITKQALKGLPMLKTMALRCTTAPCSDAVLMLQKRAQDRHGPILVKSNLTLPGEAPDAVWTTWNEFFRR